MKRYEIKGEQIDCWCSIDSLVLKAIAFFIAKRFAPIISKHCKHLKGRGGSQKAVTDLRKALATKQYAHVLRMDVHSYYASIDHEIVINQLRARVNDERILPVVRQMCERVVICDGNYKTIAEESIPRGCPLSPLLGAIYLTPLDRGVERLMKKNHIFYVRFMDDFIGLAPSQRIMRKVIKVVYRAVDELKFGLHPDKRFIGRVTRRFDFLGYWMRPDHCRVSPVSIRRFLAKTHTLLEQRADGCRLSEYWKHWKAWAHTQYLTPSGVTFVNAWLFRGLFSIRKWFQALLDESLAASIL